MIFTDFYEFNQFWLILIAYHWFKPIRLIQKLWKSIKIHANQLNSCKSIKFMKSFKKRKRFKKWAKYIFNFFKSNAFKKIKNIKTLKKIKNGAYLPGLSRLGQSPPKIDCKMKNTWMRWFWLIFMILMDFHSFNGFQWIFIAFHWFNLTRWIKNNGNQWKINNIHRIHENPPISKKSITFVKVNTQMHWLLLIYCESW